ncbi:hypothetical protein [Fibrella forsythiae]|uniref:Uncharacterized protein n=1 Tax=Fibrella forsythiae TaxID=2817061 RepID=A0ABS3JES7_9BACT|nr:hypothetical protein [Fibrella forsythiae]MBO0947387.1 hypothetical protein [Fibrella forsythiae]
MSFTQFRQPTRPTIPGSAAATSRSAWLGWLYALIFTAIPIVAVSWAWAGLAVNVPKWDDHALKAFLIALEQETSPIGWFRQVVKQHNEHRIAYDRLLTWADYSLFGKLSFKRLMIYGDLSLLALVALFGFFLKQYVRSWYLFLPPVALFIITLAQWENLYWALSSIQNFSIVVWSLACLFLLSYQSRIGWAIALAMVATLVSGNGFLVWPIGFVMLLAQHRTRQLLPWSLAAVLLIAVYFGDYVQPTTHPPTRGSLFDLAGGCLAFLGAAVDALPTATPYLYSIILGGVLLLFWCLIFLQAVARSGRKIAWTTLQTFGLGAVAFLLGTAVVVVWSRYGYGQDMLLTSRYRIYSLTLLALTYTYCISAYYASGRTNATVAVSMAFSGLLISGIFWWSAFRFNTHESISLRKMLLAMQYNWTYTTNRPVSTLDPVTRQLIDNAPAFYDATLPAFYTESKHPQFPVDSLVKRNDTYVIRLKSPSANLIPSLKEPDAGISVVLRSAKRTYLYPVMPSPQRHWRVLLNLLPLYPAGQPIEVAIPSNELDVGTYDVLIALYSTDQPNGLVRPTNQLVTVAPHRLSTGPAKNW